MSARQPLETEDLVLALYRASDRDYFLRLILDPVLMAHVDGPAGADAASDLFERIITPGSPEYTRTWAIRSKASDFIGHIWLTPSVEVPEIGFVLSQEYWNRGLASQAARRVLEYGHHEISLPLILATVDADHPASRRVLEKVGMVFDRTVADPEVPYSVYASRS